MVTLSNPGLTSLSLSLSLSLYIYKYIDEISTSASLQELKIRLINKHSFISSDIYIPFSPSLSSVFDSILGNENPKLFLAFDLGALGFCYVRFSTIL